MSETLTPAMRILMAGLPDRDIVRLHAFVRLRSSRLRHEWRVVATAPTDVYVHGIDEVPTIPGQLDRVPRQISVVDAGVDIEGHDDLLARPLQYEAFVDHLVACEESFAGSQALPERALAAATAPRFRLKRWPAAAVLDTARHGVRMASFLSSRTVSLDELVRLSGVPRGDCERFIQTLKQAGLLRDADGPLKPMAQPPSTPASAAKPLRSLFANLRARLGIRGA